LLYVPGTATPRNLALLAYMGADIVDDVQCHLESARGRLLRAELGHLHDPGDAGPEELARLNQMAMRSEVELVRHAISRSSLRELVEVRVRSEPWQVAALRRLDRHHVDLLLAECPVHRDHPLMALSRESLDRVEVTAWTRRLLERYAPPSSARVLVLLPCSARKPYSDSRTHRRIREALSGVPNRPVVHEVVLTSPLGAVPRELERMYPAAQYDIPVSGDWFPDELERMRELVEHIRRQGGYDAVVSHMGDELPFLGEDPSVAASREPSEGATAPSGLRRLADLLADASRDLPRVGWKVRSRDDLESLARFQFGAEIAAALMRDAHVEGRSPALRLKGRDGGQLAAVVPRRGLLSLTLAGAEVLAAAGRHRVWMDEFELRGDLFAVGVLDVDPDLRPEEEAVVVRGDVVVAVGVARMGAGEMLAASRGTAVAVRHKRSGGDAG
jgi:archaeosine synthase